jgi:hypothetical protein
MQIDLRGVGIGHGAAASAAIADSAGASKVGGSLGHPVVPPVFTFVGVRFDSSFPPFTTLFSG